MTVFFTLIFLILPLQAQDEFGIARGPNGELSITSKSCDELKAQVAALCEWQKEVDKVNETEAPLCKTLPAGKVRITISKCLPKFAQSLHQKKLAHEGPNCWGTAMGLHGFFPKPRFMWPEELQYWQESPLCRKLDMGEPKKPGDIINVYGKEYLQEDDLTANDPGTQFWETLYPKRTNRTNFKLGYTGYQRLLHSETYISDQLSFGKDSPAKDDPWQFHSIASMYGRPRSPGETECQENQSISPNIRQYDSKPTTSDGVKCSYFTQAHRCENYVDYFKREMKTEEEKTIFKNIEALQDIQSKLFSLVTSSAFTLSKPQIKLYVSLAEINQKKAEAELKQPGLTKAHEMLLVHEYFTAAAIKMSLQQAGLVK